MHAAGGRIVVQLMHTGRIAHSDNTPHHRQPVAPNEPDPATFYGGDHRGYTDYPILATAEH